jgi:D,D-heptose 1,7-bisphosphate phosphatase
MNRAVFLDRDNTLIHNDGDLGDPTQVRLIQGAASALASLRGLGYRIIVVSNQGGVARGKFTEKDVDAVNRKVADLVKSTSGAVIDRFYYCPFHPQGTVAQYTREHPWRKPSPGMLMQAAEDLQIDLDASWMVGDQMRDVQAGRSAGTRTVLLRDDAASPAAATGTSTSGTAPGESGGGGADFVAQSLVEAARIIAQHRHRHAEVVPPVEPKTLTQRIAGEPVKRTVVPDQPPVKSSRPFVPWAAQPVQTEDRGQKQEVRAQKPEVSETKTEGRGQKSEVGQTKAAPAPASPLAVTPAPAPASTPAPTPPAAPAPTTQAHDIPPPVEASEAHPATTEAMLSEILRLLKLQHAALGDFSLMKMLGGILQMLALGLAAFGLFNLAQPVLFLQWFAGAIFAQLLALSLQQSHR